MRVPWCRFPACLTWLLLHSVAATGPCSLAAQVPATTDTSDRGDRVEDSVPVLIAHLSPAEVPIRSQGRLLGTTPAIVWLRAGIVDLTIGARAICLGVPRPEPGDTATRIVRLRAGGIETLRGVRRCGAESPAAVSAVDPGEASPHGRRFTGECARGSAAACDSLGRLYERRDSEHHEYLRAAAYFALACDALHGDGCQDLGELLELGLGMPSALPQALARYHAACAAGHAEGCAAERRLGAAGVVRAP